MEEKDFKEYTDRFLRRYKGVLISNNNIVDFLIDFKNSVLLIEEDQQALFLDAMLNGKVNLKTNFFARKEIRGLIKQFTIAKKYIKDNKGIYFKSQLSRI